MMMGSANVSTPPGIDHYHHCTKGKTDFWSNEASENYALFIQPICRLHSRRVEGVEGDADPERAEHQQQEEQAVLPAAVERGQHGAVADLAQVNPLQVHRAVFRPVVFPEVWGVEKRSATDVPI